MKVSYRQAARDDLVRQFPYYLVEQGLPDVAIRFRVSVRQTIESLRQRPLIGGRYQPSTRDFGTCVPGQLTGLKIFVSFIFSTMKVST